MGDIKIAEILARLRREKGVTQEELAAYMGVSPAAVSKWEKDKSYPDITLLPHLAAYFNISVDGLIGYSPQLANADIWKLCCGLSLDFSEKPADEVLRKCADITKKYYSCYPLIYHIALLYVNHHSLITDKEKQKALIAEAKELCARVVAESCETLLCKDALYVQSLCALLLEEPAEVFELLGEKVTMQGNLSEGDFISQAFELAGNAEEAVKISQCAVYTHLISLINSMAYHIMLTGNGFEAGEAALSRAKELIRLFNLEELEAHSAAKVYIAGAIFYSRHSRLTEALDLLEQYADLCAGMPFPYEFKGDAFFTEIGGWLASDFYGAIPYNEKSMKQNLSAALADVSEINAALNDEPRFQQIIRKMNAK